MLEFPQVFRISNIQWRGSEPECFAAGTFAVGSGLLKFLRLRIRHLFAQHFAVISFTIVIHNLDSSAPSPHGSLTPSFFQSESDLFAFYSFKLFLKYNREGKKYLGRKRDKECYKGTLPQDF